MEKSYSISMDAKRYKKLSQKTDTGQYYQNNYKICRDLAQGIFFVGLEIIRF